MIKNYENPEELLFYLITIKAETKKNIISYIQMMKKKKLQYILKN